jgi:hypothetical protein
MVLHRLYLVTSSEEVIPLGDEEASPQIGFMLSHRLTGWELDKTGATTSRAPAADGIRFLVYQSQMSTVCVQAQAHV